MSARDVEQDRMRLTLAAIGGLAGFSVWLLTDVLMQLVDNQRLFMTFFALILGFFGVVLALVGPISLRRALFSAIAIAAPVSVLLYFASFRFDTPEAFLQTGHPVVAAILLVVLPLPYITCAQRPGEGWKSYRALFDQAWSLVVRYAAAWLFVVIFWGLILLSDTLLNLVGLDFIETLIRTEPVQAVLTGIVLGLGIAVVNELSDYVSPYLFLRLLRLLLPVFLLVVGIFILALPFRGLSGLFGSLSPAATLLAITAISITLITTAVAKNDDDAVRGGFMRGSVAALIMMTPVPALLAVYAIWLRVDEYGWTPDRLAAATTAALITIYALTYLIIVIARGRWMKRLRAANTRLALCVAAVAAGWLTPLIDPQRIATESQVVRFLQDGAPPEQIALWEMEYAWGRAGRDGIDRLVAAGDHPQARMLADRLAEVRRAGASGTLPTDVEREKRATLAEVVPIVRDGAVSASGLPMRLVESLPAYTVAQVHDACALRTPNDAPGCLAVSADFVPGARGEEYLLVFITPGGQVQLSGYMSARGRTAMTQAALRDLGDLGGRGLISLSPSAIDLIRSGEAVIEPARLNVLTIENKEILIYP